MPDPLPENNAWMPRALLAAAIGGLVLAALAGIAPTADAPGQAGALARVNDRHIDRVEYANALQALLSDKTKTPTEGDKKLVLDRLIEEELLVQRGLEIGLLESDITVRKAIANAVIEFALAQSARKTAGEQDLRAYYDANKKRFAPAAQLQVERIFVRRVDARNQPVADAETLRRRLDDIRAALRGGARFSDVARRLGDPLPPRIPRISLPRAKMVDYLGPELTRAATRLQSGTISDAIASGAGWHFLYVVRNRPGRVPPFDDMRAQIEDAFQRDADDEALRDYLNWLRQNADIVLADDAPRVEDDASDAP